MCFLWTLWFPPPVIIIKNMSVVNIQSLPSAGSTDEDLNLCCTVTAHCSSEEDGSNLTELILNHYVYVTNSIVNYLYLLLFSKKCCKFHSVLKKCWLTFIFSVFHSSKQRFYDNRCVFYKAISFWSLLGMILK